MLSSHKWGESPFRAHFEPSAQSAGAHNLVGVDRLRFPLDCPLTQGPGDEVAAHGPVGVLGDDDLARLRQIHHT